MVLKKGQVPPQPNFITEKPGLKLSERGIKVRRDTVARTTKANA